MDNLLPIGERLARLRERSGLRLSEIAERAGYKGPSSIQRFFAWNYNPTYLKHDTAVRLQKALAGLGNPPIKEEEIFGLTKQAGEAGRVRANILSDAVETQTLIPLMYGMVDKTPYKIENIQLSTFSFSSERVSHPFRMPSHLRKIGISAFYMPRSNMEPKIKFGDIIFFSTGLQIKMGDEVLIDLTPNPGPTGKFMIATVYDATEIEYTFKQLNPPLTFSIPTDRMGGLRKVLKIEDILAPVI